jgi:hypothetical protein
MGSGRAGDEKDGGGKKRGNNPAAADGAARSTASIEGKLRLIRPASEGAILVDRREDDSGFSHDEFCRSFQLNPLSWQRAEFQPSLGISENSESFARRRRQKLKPPARRDGCPRLQAGHQFVAIPFAKY